MRGGEGAAVGSAARWWDDAVVYQIYPRSFQDSDGDGVGDLPGITRRLDHIAELGADALWLSPIHPSPMVDFGYDVADFHAIDPVFGTLEDFEEMAREAHARGLRVLLDLVPSHTSTEHPWFRERPDFYVWHRGDAPPNNWVSAFGGSAWAWDAEREAWYLHSYYPEQADLDWRNPDVVAAMQDVVRFWLDRGADGFRLDAIARLGKDPALRDDPPATGAGLGVLAQGYPPDYDALDHVHSANVDDGVRAALAAIRDAAGDALLIGEFYLPVEHWPRYLESTDVAFAFEVLRQPAPWSARALGEAIARAAAYGDATGWVFSNHDNPRLATRLGRARLRAAAVLLLTLPGMAFLYQGDEIGLEDGPGHDPPYDRRGRDPCRHPMQWEPDEHGGFTDGTPWLEAVDPFERSVAAQRGDPGSLLELHRALLRLRRDLAPGFELLDAGDDMLAYRRGGHVVAINLGDAPRPLPVSGAVVLATGEDAVRDGALGPDAAVVLEGR